MGTLAWFFDQRPHMVISYMLTRFIPQEEPLLKPSFIVEEKLQIDAAYKNYVTTRMPLIVR